MDERDVIRALETLNARAIELRSSKEYAAGVRRGNLDRLLADKSLDGVRRAVREFQTFRAFSKAPRHEELPNLPPDKWEASLQPGDAHKRVVIYTCVAGGYDNLLPPIYRSERIHYVLFSNVEALQDVEGWEWRPFPEAVERLGANTWASRYLKSHPHDLFAGDFDASVYVDGNVQPVSDLSYYAKLIDPRAGFSMHRHRVRDTIAEEAIACKALGKGNATALDVEIECYVSQGFPLEYGLLETNIVATDLQNEKAHEILSAWWDAINRAGSGRDQISLPYVLWTHGVSVDAVATMGCNPYRDTKIFISNHK